MRVVLLPIAPGRSGGSAARPLGVTVPARRSVPCAGEKFLPLAGTREDPGLRRHAADHEGACASGDARGSEGAMPQGYAASYLVPAGVRSTGMPFGGR
jgi:hypothetical protein